MLYIYIFVRRRMNLFVLSGTGILLAYPDLGYGIALLFGGMLGAVFVRGILVLIEARRLAKEGVLRHTEE